MSVIFGSIFCFLAIGLVGAHSAYDKLSLHERTCHGVWMPSVHLHGYCFVDTSARSNCTEVSRLFKTESNQFNEVAFDKVPFLVRLRALQEHALLRNSDRQLCINFDTGYHEPVTGCELNYHYFNGTCYTATKRRVSFEQAKQECTNIGDGGRLIGGDQHIATNDLELKLALDLTRYYIKNDVFTAYVQIDPSGEDVVDPLNNAHVEVDYETDRLQFVHSNEQRGFICAIKPYTKAKQLADPVVLPYYADNLLVYDPYPAPPVKPSVERYLVDLLRFRCPGNFSTKGVTEPDVLRYRVDLDDIDANFPYGCHFEQSVGNLIANLNNPRTRPPELDSVCKSLVPVYRHYDNVLRQEYFAIHKPKRYRFGGSDDPETTDPIGFCAQRKGDCGASIPLLNVGSSRHVCYLFKSNRNLAYELRESRPLRFVQLSSSRLVNIYTSKHEKSDDITVQSDSAPDSDSAEPILLASLISPLHHKELDDYCKTYLVPLYRIRNLKGHNEFLITSEHNVRQYREQRDEFTEEELLGYCSSLPGYCGASLPLHHYILREKGHRDDAYYNIEQPFGSDVQHDIICYAY